MGSVSQVYDEFGLDDDVDDDAMVDDRRCLKVKFSCPTTRRVSVVDVGRRGAIAQEMLQHRVLVVL